MATAFLPTTAFLLPVFAGLTTAVAARNAMQQETDGGDDAKETDGGDDDGHLAGGVAEKGTV